MERSVMDMTLELTQSYSHTQVTVKRGDTHRSLRIHLADGGRPYRLERNCNAIFTGVKPDGSHLYNACRMEGDAIIYDLTAQTTAIPGELACELRLYGENGALLTSAAFGITVADTVYADGDENVVSTGEATALTKLLDKVQGKIDQMDAVLANEANHAVIDDTKVGDDAWSSKNIVDKLCPVFTESGSVVTCTPMEGYPLEVTGVTKGATEITLYHSGKNLFNGGAYKYTGSYTGKATWDNGVLEMYGYLASAYLPAKPSTTYAISYKSTRTGDAGGGIYIQTTTHSGVTVSLLSKINNLNGSFTFTTREDTSEIQIMFYGGGKTNATTSATYWDVQLEIADAPTDYAHYRGQTVTADTSGVEGSYTWPAIAALPGTNYLYSDSGDITVTGRQDLQTLITKLIKEETDG